MLSAIALLGLAAAQTQPVGDWKIHNNFKNEGTGGSALDGTYISKSAFTVNALGKTGNFDHTFIMDVMLPKEDPVKREWMLNFGQRSAGANHWLYNPRHNNQFGRWDGPQVTEAIPKTGKRMIIASSYDSESGKYTVYVNGQVHGSVTKMLNLQNSVLNVGENQHKELDFSGTVYRLQYYDSVIDEADLLDMTNPNHVYLDVKYSEDSYAPHTIENMGFIGNFDHTICVDLKLPETDPATREWIMNFGQTTTGAHHWLYNPKNQSPNHGHIQFGAWNGPQVKNEIPQTGKKMKITATYNAENGEYIVYVNGKVHGTVTTTLNIQNSIIRVGQKLASGADFTGTILRLRYWDRVLAQDEVPAMKCHLRS